MRVRVQIGSSPISCVVAGSPEEWATGLQRHASLPPDEGMLFIFDEPGTRTFHMGDVRFPIDIIGVSPNGIVTRIARDCQPGSLDRWSFPDTSHVVEVPAGFCKAHNVTAGSVVRVEEAEPHKRASLDGDAVGLVPQLEEHDADSDITEHLTYSDSLRPDEGSVETTAMPVDKGFGYMEVQAGSEPKRSEPTGPMRLRLRRKAQVMTDLEFSQLSATDRQKLKRLQERAESLRKDVEVAYERGEVDLAESLDVQSAELDAYIDEYISDLHDPGEEQHHGGIGSTAPEDLLTVFAGIWARFLGNNAHDGLSGDLEATLATLRGSALEHGADPEKVTNKVLQDAAEDAYARRMQLRTRTAAWEGTCIRGEWWIDPDGVSQYADGDVGDQGHEGIAFEHFLWSKSEELVSTMREWMAANPDAVADYEYTELDSEDLLGEYFNNRIPREVLDLVFGSVWQEVEDDVRTAYSKHFGMIHAINTSFSCWQFDSRAMRAIQRFLEEEASQDIIDEDEFKAACEDTQVYLEQMNPRRTASCSVADFLALKRPAQLWQMGRMAKRVAVKTCPSCHGEGVIPHQSCLGRGCDSCGWDGMIGCSICDTSGLIPGNADVIPFPSKRRATVVTFELLCGQRGVNWDIAKANAEVAQDVTTALGSNLRQWETNDGEYLDSYLDVPEEQADIALHALQAAGVEVHYQDSKALNKGAKRIAVKTSGLVVHAPNIVETTNFEGACKLHGKDAPEEWRAPWCGGRTEELYDNYGGGSRRRFIVYPDGPDDFIEVDGIGQVPVARRKFTVSVGAKGTLENINDSKNRYPGDNAYDKEGARAVLAILRAAGFYDGKSEQTWDGIPHAESWADAGFNPDAARYWEPLFYKMTSWWDFTEFEHENRVYRVIKQIDDWRRTGMDVDECIEWWTNGVAVRDAKWLRQTYKLNGETVGKWQAAEGAETPDVPLYAAMTQAGLTRDDLPLARYFRHGLSTEDDREAAEIARKVLLAKQLEAIGWNVVRAPFDDWFDWVFFDPRRRLKFVLKNNPSDHIMEQLASLDAGQAPYAMLQTIREAGEDPETYEWSSTNVIDLREELGLPAKRQAQVVWTLYHGSDEPDIETFKPSFAGPRGYFGTGVYTTPDGANKRQAQIVDEGKFVEKMSDILIGKPDLQWTDDVLNAGATERVVVSKADLRAWLEPHVPQAQLDSITRAMSDQRGLNLIGDAFILAGLADIARVGFSGQGPALVLYRKNRDEETG